MALYNANGNLRVTVDDISLPFGLYAADGSIRVTVVDGSSLEGLYAPDGSINVVVIEENDTGVGRYHPSGALRGVPTDGNEIGLYTANGGLYMDGLSNANKHLAAAAGTYTITGTAATIGRAVSNTVAPVISGVNTIGSTLTTTDGTWAGMPAPTFTYQWYNEATPISGATNNTYVATPADEGYGITCRVTGTNVFNSASADSNEIVIGDGNTIVLSSFVDDLDLDPPVATFTASEVGTGTWDFHSSATPPAKGAGDIGTGTFPISEGADSYEIDLTAYPGETGYIHIRATDADGDSNVLTSQQITVPGGSSNAVLRTDNSYSLRTDGSKILRVA